MGSPVFLAGTELLGEVSSRELGDPVTWFIALDREQKRLVYAVDLSYHERQGETEGLSGAPSCGLNVEIQVADLVGHQPSHVRLDGRLVEKRKLVKVA